MSLEERPCRNNTPNGLVRIGKNIALPPMLNADLVPFGADTGKFGYLAANMLGIDGSIRTRTLPGIPRNVFLRHYCIVNFYLVNKSLEGRHLIFRLFAVANLPDSCVGDRRRYPSRAQR